MVSIGSHPQDHAILRSVRQLRIVFCLSLCWALVTNVVFADDSDSDRRAGSAIERVEKDNADSDQEERDKQRDLDRRRRERDRREREREESRRQQVKADDEFDENAPARRYRDGRLVISDFDMEPPEDRDNLDAMLATQVRIQFDYRCRYGRRYGGGARATLKRIEVFAVVRPQESWIATPEDRRLLDHEQGHFDIAQIAALSARLHMHEQWKAGELKGTGDDPDEAIANLRENIQSEMKPFYDNLKKAQRQYDDVTSHGRRFRSQREQRKVHDEFLKELNKKWEQSEWYQERRRRRPLLADVSKAKSDDEEDKGESDDEK